MRIPIESSRSYRGRNSRPNWLALLVFVGVALGVGAVGAIFSPGMSASSAAWYGALIRPEWAPPNSWFGPIWTALYVLMGICGWLAWSERYHRGRDAALASYAIQLFINALWSPFFFGVKSAGSGLFIIVALWLSIVWMIREFWTVKPAAAWMSLPYLVWVSYAAALNLSIWRLNP